MIRYRVRLASLNRHHFEVNCRVGNPSPAHRFTLPSWTPGSYLLREYAKHVVGIRAESDGGSVALEKVSKSAWRCHNAGVELTVTVEVFALDRSVRGAYLDSRRGYFNGACLFLSPEGRETDPVEVVLERPEDPRAQGWRVATAMHAVEVDADGFGRYSAENFDELIDHPFEIGDLAEVEFRAAQVPHRLVISGRHQTDMDRIGADLARLCEAHIELFGRPPPFRQYLFLGCAVGRGYGGLEHRASSSLIFSRDNLPVRGKAGVSEKYQRFLSLCSHEYFHAWNVKRIKPQAFSPYRLDRRSYTRLLWVVEGVTSYYQDVLLLRSGLIGTAAYLRDLWQRYGRADEGMPESAFEQLVQEVSGLDLSDFFAAAVRGTEDLPLAELLADFGVTLEFRRDARFGSAASNTRAAGSPPLELGIRFRQHGGGLEVVAVMTDGPVERAGVSPGDILIAIEGLMLSEKNLQTRLARFEAGQTVRITGFRDEELLEFPVTLAGAALDSCALSLVDKPGPDALSRRQAWLGA